MPADYGSACREAGLPVANNAGSGITTMTGRNRAHVRFSASLFKSTTEAGCRRSRRIPEGARQRNSGGRERYSTCAGKQAPVIGEIDLSFPWVSCPSRSSGMPTTRRTFRRHGGKEAIDRVITWRGVRHGSIMGRADTRAGAVRRGSGRGRGRFLRSPGFYGDRHGGGRLSRTAGYFASSTGAVSKKRRFDRAGQHPALENGRKAVVWLDPEEYRSTGSATIVTERMAMARALELLIFAPGLRRFRGRSEYRAVIRLRLPPGSEKSSLVAREPALAETSRRPHLIHGSSEAVPLSYAPAPSNSREEIESVGTDGRSRPRAQALRPHGRLAASNDADGVILLCTESFVGLGRRQRMQGA